jgi:transcriptional regulator with XRE-family HTH domain
MNIITKRYFDFIEQKLKNKEFTVKEIAEIMGISAKNPSMYLSRLKNGKEVSVDEILLASEKLGLNLSKLFESNYNRYAVSSDDELLILNEEKEVYYSRKTHSKIQGEKLQKMLEQSNVTVKKISDNTGYSKSDIDKMLKGEIMIPLDIAIRISEICDLSLDRLRTFELVNGDYKSEIKELKEKIIQLYRELEYKSKAS